jgi:CBS domain-containing protein
MRAKDVMTTEVFSVTIDTSVEDVAALLLRQGISGVPVTDQGGAVVGIVSEGDLMRRPEIGTEDGRGASSWLSLLSDVDEKVKTYVRSHGHRAGDVMSREVISADEDTPLGDIARQLEKHRIKRVPVLRDRRLVGIVSRANLVQALSAVEGHAPEPPEEDRELRVRVEKAVRGAGVQMNFLNVIVHDGQVEIWGAVESRIERDAVRVALEETVPPDRVTYHMGLLPERMRSMMWGV